MLIVFFRAVILYIVVVFCMRLMGKKQLGQLQPSEFVVTILLSNIATLPIEDINIPVMMGLVPIVTIVSFDVFISYLSLYSKGFRRMVCGSPKIIINEGKIDQPLMKKLRFTVDDLLESLREQQVFDIAQVQLAVVETTGQLSVYVKHSKGTLTPEDANVKVSDDDPPQLIIDNGKVLNDSLALIGFGEGWLEHILDDEKTTLDEVFIMTCDKSGKYNIIKKEK